MRNIITVMNAKGGVGKSTLVLALVETLVTYPGKRILVIDAVAQASVSHLLARQPQLEVAQSGGRTIVDFLTSTVLKEFNAAWQEFVLADVSDVDDALSFHSCRATRSLRCSSERSRRATMKPDCAEPSARG